MSVIGATKTLVFCLSACGGVTTPRGSIGWPWLGSTPPNIYSRSMVESTCLLYTLCCHLTLKMLHEGKNSFDRG